MSKIRGIRYFIRYISLTVPIVIGSCLPAIDTNPPSPYKPSVDKKSILETVGFYYDLHSFRMALRETDLEYDLETNGPFTVFIPENDRLDHYIWLNGYNSYSEVPVDKITTLIRAHVIRGSIRSRDLPSGYINTLAVEKTTENPIQIYIDRKEGVKINGDILINSPNFPATNGIIHTINQVMEPPTLDRHIHADKTFSILSELMSRADLRVDYYSILSGEGPFTLFAPSNEAFEYLFETNPEWNEIDDIPANQLELLLDNHIYRGKNILFNKLESGQELNSRSDMMLEIRGKGLKKYLVFDNTTKSNFIAIDIQAINGVTHIIDQVLISEQ